jgi:plasmid stability protein
LDQEVAAHCVEPKCLDASKACAKAVSRGFTNVYYFRDGFPGWTAAGNPVATQQFIAKSLFDKSGPSRHEVAAHSTVVDCGTLHAIIASNACRGDRTMASLTVRNLDPEIVDALKQRAAARGHSAEAEHRESLKATLLRPPRRNFAEVLAAMPDVGQDQDFARVEMQGEALDVLG